MFGARDRDQFLDFNPAPDSDMPQTIGGYTGAYSSFNVQNPQPGRVYYHICDTESGRRQARARLCRFVGPDDPERVHEKLDQVNDHLPYDSSQSATPGYILAYRTVEDEAKIRADQAKMRHNLLHGGDAEQNFLQGRAPGEHLYQDRVSTRFSQGHRTFIRSGVGDDSKILDSWDPSQGLA